MSDREDTSESEFSAPNSEDELEYSPQIARKRRTPKRPRFEAPSFRTPVRHAPPVHPSPLPPPRGSMRSVCESSPSLPLPAGTPRTSAMNSSSACALRPPELVVPPATTSDISSSPLLASSRGTVPVPPTHPQNLTAQLVFRPRVSVSGPTDDSQNTRIQALTPPALFPPSPTSNQAKARTSIIWQHGSEQWFNNVLHWVCSQCSHRLRFSGSTTTAKSHLRTHGIVERASPPPDLTATPDRATQDLCIFIAASHLPLVKVQHPRFTHLPRIADQIRLAISSVRRPLFLTTDLWTGRSREKFLGVTAHYTTQNWELHSMVLGVKHCEAEPTDGVISARVISIVLKEVLEEINVTRDQIMAVTTDNGADILCAARLVDVPIFRCAAHSLQIALRAFLDTPLIKNYIHNATELVAGLRARSKDMDLLKTTFHAAYPGFPYQELQKPCKTRWGGTFRMINSLLNHWWVLWSTSFRADCSSSNLRSDDLPAYELILKLLKPFAELHDRMQTRSRPAVAETLARLWVLTDSPLPDPTTEISEAFRTRAVPVIQDYVRSQLTSEVIAGICFLDPRFKCFSWWTESNLLPKAQSWLSVQIPEEAHSMETSGGNFNWVAELSYETAATTRTHQASEVELYRSLPVVNCHDVHDFLEFSPLKWWKQEEKRFPRLARVAQAWLALQVTSAAVESEFSSCGYTMTDRRTRMKGDTLSLLEFVGRNEHLLPDDDSS